MTLWPFHLNVGEIVPLSESQQLPIIPHPSLVIASDLKEATIQLLKLNHLALRGQQQLGTRSVELYISCLNSVLSKFNNLDPGAIDL